uniref:Tctex1 domain-containing protein 1-like n=1 Tax=Saccoglossus kowalevskii TaxID=10224 RepID=A0ABM0GLM1_SACKO|nr:PREDICTED: tctex1 domain-containing protein 1-like [Saccoglossus kowalevskii]
MEKRSKSDDENASTSSLVKSESLYEVTPRENRDTDGAYKRSGRLTLGVIRVLGRLISRTRDYSWSSPRRYNTGISSSTYHQSRNIDVSAPKVVVENTYKLLPDKRFPVETVKNVIQQILNDDLLECEYKADVIAEKTKSITDTIKYRVKRLNVKRFKIVCIVTIGKINGQEVIAAGRCLWDHNVDNFATATFKNRSIFAFATVYGVYFE